MKNLIALLLIALITSCSSNQSTENITPTTYCNPLDLSYRFGMEEPSRREAADPTVVKFKETYFLFASKSGGYWHSTDLAQWTFIETNQIPTEEYAPTAIVIADTIYFLASSNEKSTIYKSTDPLSGQWSIAKEELQTPVWDPAFFMDDDNRLYLYWGCSNVNPIYGVEVDYKNNFNFIGQPQALFTPQPNKYGWEVPGDYNTLTQQSPWIEGAWMNKHNGNYYLQYSGPGTEYKSYADAVYVSANPLGPYTVQEHNPFAYKPNGFASGAGHGSTFTDNYGNLWHIGTITISQKHMFERRLGLFPAFYDESGTLYSTTKFGDYPMIVPTKKIAGFEEIFPGWMLLSYKKGVTVSSSIDSLGAENMVDENIRTYWAAQSGAANEFAILDLGNQYDVYTLQINFAEHNTALFNRPKNIKHRYVIEYSTDGVTYTKLIDKLANNSDNTHNYHQLTNKLSCRYLKITNAEVPDGNFAISGFRVFGLGNGQAPAEISEISALRNANDKRSVTLKWEKIANATGYNISYGTNKNSLYHNYTVYEDTVVTINSLNSQIGYYFTIEAFNENGVTKSLKTVMVQ